MATTQQEVEVRRGKHIARWAEGAVRMMRIQHNKCALIWVASLVILWSSSAACLAESPSGAAPSNIAASPVLPFIDVAVSTQSLHLGTIVGPGQHLPGEGLSIRVTSNVPHGGIAARMSNLENSERSWRTGYGRGGSALPTTIPAESVFVRTNLLGQYVPLNAPVVIVPPTSGAGTVEVAADFRVQVAPLTRPGTYQGTLTLLFGGGH